MDVAGNPSHTAGPTTTATVNSVLSDIDNGLNPALSVNAVNPTQISAGETVELSSSYSGTISFAGATGTLIIDHSSSFSGTIAGQLGIGNLIDLEDITAGANATVSYSGNNSPGTLTVSDGTHTANIALNGNYSPANFTVSSDGHGGTLLVDPPVAPTIVSFSPDSGTVGDGITNNSTLTLTGTAAANSTVNVFDGTTSLGSATANSSGAWSYTTGALSNGTHSLTAATAGGGTSSPSSGFPDASSAGVPAGTVLTTVNGDFTSSYAGQIIDGLNVHGTIIVNNPGVIIKNCDARYIIVNAANCTIQDSDIVGNQGGAAPISSANGIDIEANYATVQRCSISGVENGIWLESNGCLIKDNYLHDFIPYTPQKDPHIDGIQIPGGSGVANNIIQHNNIDLPQAGVNSCITMAGATNITIDNNRLNGGGYTVYFEGKNFAPIDTTGCAVTNNVFGAHDYGYVTGASETLQTYSGNVTATGVPLAESLSWQDLLPGTGTASAGTAGSTTATSAPLSVTIDTVAPNAPVETGASIVSGTTKVQLTGTAEANSTLQVFDGNTQVGTATANSSGAWSLTTGTLASGGRSFTAKATDAAGNTGLASAALAVTIPSAPTAPAAPTIASFSTDSGVAGDHITNDNTLTLSGTAAANSTLKVFDGTTQIATATADSSGAWSSAATTALADGSHNLTATATNESGTSTVSAAIAVTIDTAAPSAPTIVASTSQATLASTHVEVLAGTAEANSTMAVFDGTTKIGAATANSSGAWNYTTAALSTGSHGFTATATDAAGNISAASSALNVTIDPPASGSADGAANAPAGAPQLPHLLDGYAVRPAWQVAGVDYAVGVPAGMSLKDPTIAANLPAGVTIDSVNHVLNIKGNNVTLNGFDFSLHGGWGVNIQAGTTGTTTIENCNFSMGANQPLAIVANATNVGNLTVVNCSFDGNRMDIPSVQPPPAGTGMGSAIDYEGTGTFIAKYNYIHDMPADGIDLGGGTPTIEYNVFQGLGYTPGSHPDAIQFTGGAYNNAMIAFNAIYQPQGVEANTGLAIAAQLGSTITNTTVANNVVIATGPGKGSSITLNIGLFQNAGDVLNGVVVSNNYLDPTGSLTPTGFGDIANEVQGSNLTIVNNVNLLTGKTTAPTAGSFSTTDVKSVVASPATGTEVVGNSITFTVNFDQSMTVTGTPTLKLNDGGVATYTGGTGTSALTFSYTVGASDSKVSTLAISQVNLPGSATITNSLGDAANLSGALKTFAGLQVDPGSAPASTPPNAPTIASFSQDSGVVGDHITNDNTLTLTGTAAANSTVKVLDGSTPVGTATADSNGAWTLAATTLSNGSHSLTATATNSGGTSSASAPLSVTVDTVAPSAPTIVASTSAATLASTHVEVLTGTAEANSTI
ncbi:MAG: hypothetical protein JWO19_6134, partial [Bryobacterales bacterium]|nr:hypothetical protein [Bryobacterales bacterium]